MPFLENVLRGRNVPRERMLEVAEHYQHFGGVSPINDQNRALMAAVEKEFAATRDQAAGVLGQPQLASTVAGYAAADEAGRRETGASRFSRRAFSSYSGCRQYRENIAAAQAEVGEGAPQVDKLRVFFNHPGFIEPMVEKTAAALAQIPAERRARRNCCSPRTAFRQSMAATCQYEIQLREASRLIAAGVARDDWRLVYQSRSGPPNQPWLEPDVGDALKEIAPAGGKDVVVVPIGFISDHMEVLFDLDEEAQNIARQLGLHMVRAATVGTHPRFVRMIRELVQERLSENPSRLSLGNLGPSHDVCPVDCCAYQPRKPA